MAKNQLPEILFVGRKAKEPYKLTVFVIEEQDADGTPRRLRLVKDDEKVEIAQGMSFMTAYVPQHMLKE